MNACRASSERDTVLPGLIDCPPLLLKVDLLTDVRSQPGQMQPLWV